MGTSRAAKVHSPESQAVSSVSSDPATLGHRDRSTDQVTPYSLQGLPFSLPWRTGCTSGGCLGAPPTFSAPALSPYLCVQEVFKGVSLGKACGGSRTEHIQCSFNKSLSPSLGEPWGWGEARVLDLCIRLDQSFNSSFCLEGSMTWHGVGGNGLVGLFIWGQFLEVVHSQCANQLGIPAFFWKQGR